MAAAATVAVLGGGLILALNAHTPPPVALPSEPVDRVEVPATPPSAEPAPGTASSEPAQATPSSTLTSTFPPLQDVPEVCDLLPESLTSRLAPLSVSAPGVSKDGYGAKRKDCVWNQKGYDMKGGYHEYRSIRLKVNVFPDHESAWDDADFMWDSMRDSSGQTKGAPYNTKHGEIRQISGLGDEAYAIYQRNTARGTAFGWIYVVRGNTTIDVAFHGTATKGREVASSENSRPVPEDVLLKGVEEVAEEALKGLTG